MITPKAITGLPVLWGTLGASTISDHTGISIGLVVAGIIGSVAMAWRARGEVDKINRSIKELKDNVKQIQETLKEG